MPKVIVTPELAATLKSLRTSNGVTARALAEHIEKSPSYISKFEKGEIKTVTRNELDEIIRFCVTDESSFHDKVDEILRTASFRFTSKEVKAQLWFQNYSTAFCKIPLPSRLIDDINDLMSTYSITRDVLCKRINSNEFITNPDGTEKKGNDHFPKNEWFVRDQSDCKTLEIIIDISRERVDEILDKQVTGTRYIYMQAIVLYIKKIIRFGDVQSIPDEDAQLLCSDTQEYLSGYDFYPLSEKYARIAEARPLSIPDQRNQDEIDMLTARIHGFSDVNVQFANDLLRRLNKSLEWNPAFISGLLSLPFNELGNTSPSFKQSVLNQIKNVVEKAIDEPDEIKEAEFYD